MTRSAGDCPTAFSRPTGRASTTPTSRPTPPSRASTAPLWLFGDQLGPAVHALPQHADREVVLVESSAVLRRRRYHRQKLHLVLSGMRHLDEELGDRATYHRTTTYREALEKVGRPVVVHQPTSHAAVAFVERLRAEGLVAAVLPTTTFARPRAEFERVGR